MTDSQAEKGEEGEVMAKPATVQDRKVQGASEAVATVQETPVEVNERGFMIDPSQWTPGAALHLARGQGLRGWPRELVSDHWRVIDYMRTYHQTTGNAPSLRYTCRALGLTKRQFSRLFPGGMMTVRRIAGLPGQRRSANRRELSLARRLMTRNWWEILTSPGLRQESPTVTGGRVSATPNSVRSSRRGSSVREPKESSKGRKLSSSQQLLTGDWWARLTGD
jgi:tRNA 2-thiouridine synthesizing protein E